MLNLHQTTSGGCRRSAAPPSAVVYASQVYIHVGCWFGVKGDDKLGFFIPGVKQCDLSAVDVCTSAGNLSQDLLELLFSKEEMAQGCATKPRRGDVQKLDNHRIRG